MILLRLIFNFIIIFYFYSNLIILIFFLNRTIADKQRDELTEYLMKECGKFDPQTSGLSYFIIY
jgi:hypothetical protein